MTEFCRICLAYNDELITLIKSNSGENLSKSGDMFEQCLNIMLLTIPQYKICMDCNIQLKYFYDFKIKARNAHEKLLEIYQINEKDVPDTGQNPIFNNHNNESVTENECIIENVQEIDSIIKEDINDYINLEKEENNDIANDYEIEYLDHEIDLQEFQEEINVNTTEIKKIEIMNCENISKQFELDEELNDLKENNKSLNKSSNDNILTNNHLDLDQNVYKKSKKGISENFKCSHCEHKFRSEKTYLAHINMHNGLSPWICEICSKGFQYRVNYNYHMKNHENKRSFICTICSKGYICKWDLKIHESVHTKKRPFSCQFCNKSFRIRSHWKQHLQTHTDTNAFECFFCKQKYKSRASLKIHINSIHNNIKFSCNICDKSFNRKHHLVVHLKIHAKKESL